MTRFHAHFAISFFLIFCFAGFGTDYLTYAADQSSNSGEGASQSSKRKIRITRRGRSSSSELTLPQIRAALKKDAGANASLYYRAGFLEEQQGNFFQALHDYSDAVRMKARMADALYRAGVVWEKIGEFMIFAVEKKAGLYKASNADGLLILISQPYVQGLIFRMRITD